MKSIKYIIFLIFVFNLEAECQWQYFNIGSDEDLDEICFPNYNTGYVTCYPGKIYKTTNAGEDWQVVYIDSSLYAFTDIEFINDSTGFFSSRGNKILKTTNSGLNWQRITLGGFTITALNFLNQTTGFLSTWNYGKILKTTNSGLNWNELSFTFTIDFYDVQFFDNDTGYICGQDYPPLARGFIAKTTDGGNNWKRWYNTGLENHSLSFINSQTGYVADYWGTLFKTTNGGQDLQWNAIHNFQGFVSEIQAIDENVIYECGGNGNIFRSTNGGYNWERMNSQTTDHLYGLHFLNKDTGYVCGENGTILRTTNASTVGISQLSTEVPSGYKLYQNYPNPFNPVTKIKFDIAFSHNKGSPRDVSLKIYDELGKEVETLVNKKLEQGSYEVEFDGSNLSSGIYFYKLSTGDYVQTKRMVLLK